MHDGKASAHCDNLFHVHLHIFSAVNNYPLTVTQPLRLVKLLLNTEVSLRVPCD